MSTLKAIETRYNGYLFRSRLEARWALFLDRLNVPYEYEVEGFDLSAVAETPHSRIALSGRDAWYLPDFWLPDQASWMEVKPNAPTTIEKERARRLAVASKKDVVIVTGKPWVTAETVEGYDGSASGFLFSWSDDDDRVITDEYYLLTACPFCRTIAWCFSGWAGRLPCKCPNENKGVGDFARVQRASMAARVARFEFGETPITGGA